MEVSKFCHSSRDSSDRPQSVFVKDDILYLPHNASPKADDLPWLLAVPRGNTFKPVVLGALINVPYVNTGNWRLERVRASPGRHNTFLQIARNTVAQQL